MSNADAADVSFPETIGDRTLRSLKVICRVDLHIVIQHIYR